MEDKGLVRALGFWGLLAYGIGDILGAGIYALIGKVAGAAGVWSWLAFGLAMAVAALTALSYSELVTRFPHSAGEAYYCERGFRRRSVSALVGWLVFWSGVLSLATVARAFAGYLQGLWPALPDAPLLIAFLAIAGFVNFWGIRESSTANIVCTVIEASGLLLVIAVAAAFIGNVSGSASSPPDPAAATQAIPWFLVGQGAALAFFAFLGFEDMVNVAEEVKRPDRVFPAAILIALAITGCTYMLVTYLATQVVPPPELAQSDAPLLDVVERAGPWVPGWTFTAIALFAVGNTGLLNFIMASRLVYGMARRKLVPAWFDAVHHRRRTPHRAIGAVLLVVVALALSGTITFLAGTTSVLILLAFAMVNAALIAIKWRQEEPAAPFTVPLAVPILGMIASLILVGFVERASLITAALLIALGIVLIVARHWRTIRVQAS